MLLSNHFTLEELTLSQYAQRHDLDNTPNAEQVAHLTVVAQGLERVRAVLKGMPVLISSGFRSPLVNAGDGGAHDSAHLDGWAADFICPGYGDPFAVAGAIAAANPPLAFDQLILEYGWVHISFAPTMRNQCLTKKSAAAPYQDGLIA